MISVFTAILFHLLMSMTVIGLWWILFRISPTSFWAVAACSFCGPFAALFWAILIRIPSRSFCFGQRFAEGFFFEGGIFLLGCAFFLYRQRRNEKPRYAISAFALVLSLSVIAIGINSLLIEPWALEIKEYKLRSAKITRPLKIVLLADIQTDEVGRYERMASEKAVEIDADLVLFGGDYLQVNSSRNSNLLNKEIEALNALLRDFSWSAELGTFAVDGNMEYYGDWDRIFEGTGIQVSRGDNIVRLQNGEDAIVLSLLSLATTRGSGTLMAPLEGAEYHIMLGHDPSFAGLPTNADLLLAGHTHGGQVQIPGFGPLVTAARGIPRSWASGLTELPDGGTLIISNGIGMERGSAPRIRFFCRPQIVVIEIVPE